MSGKSPYASDEERRAAKAASGARRYLRIKADPASYEQSRAEKLEARALRSEAITLAKTMPKPVDAALYQRHGPFAALFALQAAA